MVKHDNCDGGDDDDDDEEEEEEAPRRRMRRRRRRRKIGFHSRCLVTCAVLFRNLDPYRMCLEDWVQGV